MKLPENITTEFLSQLATEFSLKLKYKHNRPLKSGKIVNDFAEIFGFTDWNSLNKHLNQNQTLKTINIPINSPDKDPNKLIVVYIQPWEETERGWGTRPDGISIHRSEDVVSKHCNEIMDEQEQRFGSEVPDEYSRPLTGYHYKAHIKQSKFDEIFQNDRYYRSYNHSFDWITKI
jgi:hypothetical protein